MSAARLPRQSPFDLVFADPPYAKGAGTGVAKAVAQAESRRGAIREELAGIDATAWLR